MRYSVFVLIAAMCLMGCSSRAPSPQAADSKAQGPDRDAICEQRKQYAASRQVEGRNGWPDIVAMGKRIDDFATSLLSDEPGYTAYGLVFARPGQFDPTFDLDVADLAFTTRLLSAIREERVLASLDAALAQSAFVRPGCESVDGAYGKLRTLANALTALGTVDAEAGRLHEAIAHAEQIGDIARIVAHQVGDSYMLLSHALRSRLQTVLLHIAEQPWLDAKTARHAIDLLNWTNPVDEQYVREGMRLEFLWNVAELYDETGKLRTQDYQRALTTLIELGVSIEPDAIDKPDSVLDDFAPTWREMIDNTPKSFALLQDDVIRNWKQSDDMLRSCALATQLFLAVRLYEIEYEKLPASLDTLPPEIITELPVDPVGNSPFGYRRLTDDPFDRGFIIYSYGKDGTDNGGRQHPTRPHHAVSDDSGDYDFVINHVYFREDEVHLDDTVRGPSTR